MMLLSLLQYAAAFLLGVQLSVLLSGAGEKAGRAGKLLLICAVLLVGQLVSYGLFGLSVTRRLYPLIVHLPLWALLVLLLKVPKLQTAVSVLVAYMCCQPPRWVASLGLLIPEGHWLYAVLYIPVAGLFLLFMSRYLAAPIRQLMGRSRKTCLMTGLIPAMYYLFDYMTTVYTSLLHDGNIAAVQFMPSMVSGAYLVCLVIYNGELEKQLELSVERDFLEIQLHQSKVIYDALQQSQEQILRYRHDMRHHFTLLRGFAAQDNVPKIQEYLNSAQQDMEALTPQRYCGNEVVNLLLAHYTAQAKEKKVKLAISAALPTRLPCSETELCSLLSNGLENAIHAASCMDRPEARRASIHMGMHSGNFLIQIENAYAGELSFQDGLPCGNREDHGFGTRSIRAIVRAHGGEAIFRAQNGLFQIRMLIPEEVPQGELQNR